MKNHKNLIKIVVVVAVFAACGYAVCKYVRAHNNQAKENVVIQVNKINAINAAATPK